MEAAASDGPMEGLLEKCGTFPQPSHRTLEIAVADARDSHSRLENAVADARVSHSSHRSDDGDLEGSNQRSPDPDRRQLTRPPVELPEAGANVTASASEPRKPCPRKRHLWGRCGNPGVTQLRQSGCRLTIGPTRIRPSTATATPVRTAARFLPTASRPVTPHGGRA